MCDFSQLTECLFKGLPKIKAGQRVYVVARRGSSPGDMQIESVLYADEGDGPPAILKDFCKAQGLEADNRICIPVVLPAGLKAEEVRGFRSVRNGASLHIEFTK